MEPALWELYESGTEQDEVSVIVRLAEGAAPPASLHIVSTFGEVATARVPRHSLLEAREAVFSMKAGGSVSPPRDPEEDAFDDQGSLEADQPESQVEAEASWPLDALDEREPAALRFKEDGSGVLFGICDWGFDFTHPNLRNADGTTRLIGLWDQRGGADPLSPAPFNYGKYHPREAIDAALLQPDPAAALGYDWSDSDPKSVGTHGTHVSDIAVGNRREPGSVSGLAGGADICFVHLASTHMHETQNLGDSVSLLEGLDFIRRQAAGKPCVLHLSAGKTAGPHRGNTPLELAVDSMLLQSPGLVLVQSVGNYADSAMHTHARIGPDQEHTLVWEVPERDRTPNELDIWYSGQDVFDLKLIAPDGREVSASLGERQRVVGPDGAHSGNFYHRKCEPNSKLNHAVVFLYARAPAGPWRIVITGREVVDGRLHAWIERDVGRYQSRFPRSLATPRYTTNTICNSFHAIAVGAYDATRPERPPARFSSRGPTADGRQKPEVAAPGCRIRAARSCPRGGWRGESKFTEKSGTSMAAPVCSGLIALMMQAAARPLTINEVRRILVRTADPLRGPEGRSSSRLGYGYLNIPAAVEAARKLGASESDPVPLPRASADIVARPFDANAFEQIEPYLDDEFAPAPSPPLAANSAPEASDEVAQTEADDAYDDDEDVYESEPFASERSNEGLIPPLESWNEHFYREDPPEPFDLG